MPGQAEDCEGLRKALSAYHNSAEDQFNHTASLREAVQDLAKVCARPHAAHLERQSHR